MKPGDRVIVRDRRDGAAILRGRLVALSEFEAMVEGVYCPEAFGDPPSARTTGTIRVPPRCVEPDPDAPIVPS